MASTTPGTPHKGTIRLNYSADIKSYVPAAKDLAAKSIGPPTVLAAGEVLGWNQVEPKPVLYVPVKRTKGQDAVPKLCLEIKIWETGWVTNVPIASLAGKAVQITVRNVYEGPDGPATGKPATIDGKLDSYGECNIDLPPSKVAEWLDPDKPFGGRVNEVLLDFSFVIPDVPSEGRPLAGQSQNRVYLYRRKAIVFLPGVFGSKVYVMLPDGRELGFPSFLDHNVGALECDESGVPLVKSEPPELVTMWGTVYDVGNACDGARRAQYPRLDKGFLLTQMWLHCYDWRLDLTNAAKDLADGIRDLSDQLGKRPDYDDQVAVAGHSTGGLIIRRALGLDGMDDRISHAFFLNTPFRGAPKAMGVILTGQDPPGGPPMIPLIVDPVSLRNVALSMPIVYHLSPSNAYKERVALSPDRPASNSATDVAADKRAFVNAAIDRGVRPEGTFVKSGLGKGWTTALAGDADRWHAFWNEASERQRAEAAYRLEWPSGWPAFDGWLSEQEARADNQRQVQYRVSGRWNDALARAAQNFHDESEKIANGRKWKDRAFVFYSVHPTIRTTMRVTLEEDATAQRQVADAKALTGVKFPDLLHGKARAPRPPGLTQPFTAKTKSVYSGTSPLVKTYQWSLVDNPRRVLEQAWNLWAECVPAAGDGTVPTQSLLGFGDPGTCTIFKALDWCDSLDEGGTSHVPAPNHPEVWRRIHRAIQGILLSKDVESTGSPQLVR